MERDYTIAEQYELPSKGLIYDDVEPFNPCVKIKSMTVDDDMFRQGVSINAHEKLCQLIDSLLITKLPISVYDMCIGDYDYLLHKIRVVTYGPEYKMTVGCPHCSSIQESTINLDDLKVKDFNIDEFNSYRHITLPASKDTIELNFQTPRMLDNIEAETKQYKKDNPNSTHNPTLLFILKNAIKTVNGNKLKFVELQTYLKKMNARDGNYILKKLEKLNSMIGLDTAIDVNCAQCGHNIKTYFRFGPEFFGPTNDE